jgi:deoxyhypusine synthase
MKRPPTPPVEDIDLASATTTAGLLDAFGRMGGFTTKAVADAVAALRRMTDDGATVLLSIPAAPLATGLRGVLVELVRRRLVHAVITTGGTLDHDLARTWGAYHHGSFQLDDAALWRRGYHRLGSVLVPRASYGDLLEARLREPLQRLFQSNRSVSTADLCRYLGELLAPEPKADASLLVACHRARVPVFIPGPTDGAVGSQVWLRYQQDRSIRFDLLKDEQELSDLVHGAKKLGGLILGGGISKHHLIWWAQFRGGLDYAVAVTTAVEYDGSLSGARLREAISWGKLKAGATHVTVEGDLTLVLPLLAVGWTRPQNVEGGPARERTRRARKKST